MEQSIEGEVKTRIYVASSWRNLMQQGIVYTLRAVGFEVYDFQNPPNGSGFKWSSISDKELDNPEDYLSKINHPIANQGFKSDFEAMEWADTFVLVLPCGRSAHLELGWAVGQGKKTAILLSDEDFRPELMYKMVDYISPDVMGLLAWFGVED